MSASLFRRGLGARRAFFAYHRAIIGFFAAVIEFMPDISVPVIGNRHDPVDAVMHVLFAHERQRGSGLELRGDLA